MEGPCQEVAAPDQEKQSPVENCTGTRYQEELHTQGQLPRGSGSGAGGGAMLLPDAGPRDRWLLGPQSALHPEELAVLVQLPLLVLHHPGPDVQHSESVPRWPGCTKCGILIASWHFLHLANLWPGLMRHWAAVEKRLPRYGSYMERSHPVRRIRLVAFLLLSLSLMEHLLSIIAVVYYDFCPRRRDPVESYLRGTSLHLFEVFAYSNWLGWLGKLQNVLLTFGWSYMDIFLMIIGMGLSEMLARLNRSLKRHVRHPMPEEYWTWSRTLYRSIVELIREVDDAISGIMLISFGSNLYFICLQLLKSINTMPSSAHAVYFYFSLCFLLSRSSMVLLLVSTINDRAREPLQLLRLIPSEAYHQPEVTRFAAELASDQVALTGAKFFNVTRRLFLAMAGTVATYELVLIQFHEDKKSWTCSVETFD
ncbi:uncharacterized protein Dana_GF21367, isoform B [Drosophila ananassae]|uniref:Uncharacterized protein, isoform B n=1 Tax=Drosophila ananassae TaxID=7217 RepID=A0A0P8XK33_DROAN|nr:uncharacterized protein Dana_GF21367, isoform B [Drosophila ananassae]